MGQNEDFKNSSMDFKTTFSNMVREEVPEMTQEEAIKNYKEDDTIQLMNKKNADSDDNVEESEHLKRIKEELLASLERVKKLAKKIFTEEKVKANLKVKEKSGKQQSGKGVSKKVDSSEKVAKREESEKER